MGGGQSSNLTSSKPLVTSTNDICEAADILAEMKYAHFWDKFPSQLKDGKGKDHVSLDDDDNVYSEGAFCDSEEVMVDTPEWGTKKELLDQMYDDTAPMFGDYPTPNISQTQPMTLEWDTEEELLD
ncbi:hypothetical protein FRX31_011027 [Thalictrum thalictroides]|uniref:Uncharacterized protein n=1 Tax=Thalictrum thalictroides TaxID=46969 RepID=A0A7J6WPT9_THATH|nr:hypothetical protein FRX31_011027 [Thalictrum thalictroides]